MEDDVPGTSDVPGLTRMIVMDDLIIWDSSNSELTEKHCDWISSKLRYEDFKNLTISSIFKRRTYGADRFSSISHLIEFIKGVA